MSAAPSHLPRNPTIASSRLVLRIARSRDASDLEAMFHDPRVYRYLPYARRTDTGRELVNRGRQGARTGTLYRFVVRTKEREEFVGSSILFQLDPQKRSAELGYALARRQWGHGYATESGAVLLQWAFQRLGLRRIVATVASENDASCRVLRKLGFRLEGRRRQAGHRGGRWADDLEFGLLKPEFRGCPAER